MPRRRPKPTRHQTSTEPDHAGSERLQKILAAAGLGSRRKCEELIVQGRVEVDRQVVNELGTRVNPLTQEIRVDGEVLRKPRAVYFLVNKPAGVLSTNYDPEYRVRVVDLVKSNERLFTVGRLDQYSEGLILLTNDGELANRLMHPRYGAEKTYHVLVAGRMEPATLARIKRGVHLSEGMARVAELKVKKEHAHSTELEMVLREGKNRELRRILAAVGHKVLKLRRTQIGPIKLGDLPVGAHRPLTKDELEKLQVYAQSKRVPVKAKRTRPLRSRPRDEEEVEEVEPLIDESDAALAGGPTGPVLVDDDLSDFEGASDIGFRPRRPGAVIAFDDDVAAEPESRPSRPPRGRKQAAPRGAGGRGKKKFARRPEGKGTGSDRSAPARRKFAKKQATKKQARRKGRP